jgi:hypothetical protein
MVHQGPLRSETFPGFEIIADFSSQLEALEFIVHTMLRENNIP